MIVDGRVAARRCRGATISSSGSPQIAAARSTGHSSSRARELGPADGVCRPATPRRWRRRRGSRASARARARRRCRGAARCARRSARPCGERSGSMQTTWAPAATRLVDVLPDVHAGRERVRAPDHDQPRRRQGLGIDADLTADRRLRGGAPGGRADRRLEPRCAESRRGSAAAARTTGSCPIEPAKKNGRIASGPCRSIVRCSPSATRSSASSQPMRANCPPLRRRCAPSGAAAGRRSGGRGTG